MLRLSESLLPVPLLLELVGHHSELDSRSAAQRAPTVWPSCGVSCAAARAIKSDLAAVFGQPQASAAGTQRNTVSDLLVRSHGKVERAPERMQDAAPATEIYVTIPAAG